MRWTTVEEDGALPGLGGAPVTHPEFAGVEFLHVRAKSLLNHVPGAAGLPFEWTINVYRGCTHDCVYCFARPSHAWLELDPTTDFGRRIVVKVNAVEVLRRELARPGWGGHAVALGTNTDPYQRCEGRYRLTRGVVETLVAAGNPFTVLTKGTLALRDLDLFVAAQERVGTSVSFSIPTLDRELWRLAEPGTPEPDARLAAVAQLAEAGVPSGVMIAPLLPGLNDAPEHLRPLVRAALDAGASFVSPIVLHLRPGVRGPFLAWLDRHRPGLRARYDELYAGTYAPRETQARLTARVKRIVAELGGPRRLTVGAREARASGHDTPPPTPPGPRPAAAGHRQLTMTLS